jgi:hypothetical protein
VFEDGAKDNITRALDLTARVHDRLVGIGRRPRSLQHVDADHIDRLPNLETLFTGLDVKHLEDTVARKDRVTNCSARACSTSPDSNSASLLRSLNGAAETTRPIRRRYGSPVRAVIKEKREVAKGTLLVVFDLLGEEVDFKPGQYFWVTLLDPPYDDEKGPRRHISVVTSPNERGVLGLCTRLRDTAFKRSLAELPIGAEVDVEEPKGTFLLPDDTDQPYVFIAGGIGITVFRCMLRYIAEEKLPYRIARLLEP